MDSRERAFEPKGQAMTKAQLTDFLKKLELAKKECQACAWDYPRSCLQDNELHYEINYTLRGGNWEWYYSASRRNNRAFWDNSIAHCKQLIAETKE